MKKNSFGGLIKGIKKAYSFGKNDSDFSTKLDPKGGLTKNIIKSSMAVGGIKAVGKVSPAVASYLKEASKPMLDRWAPAITRAIPRSKRLADIAAKAKLFSKMIKR